MTIYLGATCDPTNGRITLTASGIGHACCALVERSTDQSNWITVRGASCWPVSGVTGVSGVGWVFPCLLYDYEYDTCVDNYYRLTTSCPDEDITFIAAGAASSGSSGSRTPGLPVGTSSVYRDLVVIYAGSRALAATVDTPTGWTAISPSGRARMLARVYDGTWAMPTVTFTGDTANEDTLAQAATIRNAGLPALSSNKRDYSVPTQNLTAPGAFDSGGHHINLRGAFKNDDWTSVDPPTGYTEIGEPDSTAGNDAGLTWAYLIEDTLLAAVQADVTFTVTGGATGVSVGSAVILGRADSLETSTLGPVSCSNGNLFWLKDPARPVLNVGIDLSCPSYTDPTIRVMWPSNPTVRRRARSGLFPIVGRTYPVAATDLRLAREWQIDLRTQGASGFGRIDDLLATGDVLFIQPPCDCLLAYPGGYVAALDISYEPHPVIADRLDWTIPVVEVAAPGPDVGEGCPVTVPVA